MSPAALDEHDGDTQHEDALRARVDHRNVEIGNDRYSEVTWVTAARAEDSSTMALFSATAATSDCTARLLKARGWPQLT